MDDINLIKLENMSTMEELVPVYATDNDIKVVNARELHEVLGVKKKFADWIKQNLNNYKMAETIENTQFPLKEKLDFDYCTIEIKGDGPRKRIEYILTLDTAKELAMMSRCEKGREVRKYFIAVEKILNNVVEVLSNSESTSEEKIAEALILAQAVIAKKNDELIKANRNKEYNKKVNIELRKERKKLIKKIVELENIQTSNSTNIIEEDINSKAIDELKDRLDYIEGALERKEEECYQLSERIKTLLTVKLNGKAILESFTSIDKKRRQAITLNKKNKEQARIDAYIFRKNSILEAGIIVDDNESRFIDQINIEDMPQALIAYAEALRKIINNIDYYESLFEVPLKRLKEYLDNVEEERENDFIEKNVKAKEISLLEKSKAV